MVTSRYQPTTELPESSTLLSSSATRGVQHAITMPPLPSSNERRDHHVGETEQERRAPRDAEKGVQNDPV